MPVWGTGIAPKPLSLPRTPKELSGAGELCDPGCGSGGGGYVLLGLPKGFF